MLLVSSHLDLLTLFYNPYAFPFSDSYVFIRADIMQILEQGIKPDLLKGQFDAVQRLEGNNTAGIIERFRTMYGLNYTGAAQVYGMMGNMGKEGGFSAEKIAKMIEEMKTDPKYQSDSALLSDTLNSLKNDGIKIGMLEFDNTEIKLLREQAEILAKELQERQRGGVPEARFSESTHELVEATRQNLEDNGFSLSDNQSQIDMLGAYVQGFRMTESHIVSNRLASLSRGGTEGDANAQIAGRKFNGILPYLENPSENIIDLIYELQNEYHESTRNGRGKEAGDKIGTGELETLTNIMNTILRQLGILDGTLDKLHEDGVPVYGEATLEETL